MSGSFENKKELRFIITLGTGKFGSSSNNQIQLEGFRSTVVIDKAGGMMMGTLRAQIYGVKQSDMNSITTLQWKPRSLIPNTVEVYAIDGAQETLVFTGNIVNAWGNYQGMPEVFLQIQAQSAYFAQLTPVAPRSYKGQIDVASIMAQIARTMGFTFENNGVNVQLSDMYLANTGLEQAKTLSRAAGIDLYVDDGILAITPPNTPRKGLIPEISKETGLIGYPTFDGSGINFQILFNPSVVFGGAIKLKTDIVQAAGQWVVTSVGYNLESEKPGGAWFATVRGNPNGLALSK
jgi:opacity protein-like surface antigen